MSTLLASLYDVVVDNPIVAKDASLVLRRRRTIAVWALAAIAVIVTSVTVAVEKAGSLRWYGTLNPVGDDLMMVVTGIALAAVTLLVPAFASSSIAGEREQGTLPLLLVTGLSPLRIVVGKFLAVLVVVAPFIALAFPPLGYAAVLLGVELIDVVLAAAGIAATAVSAASVGVYVSAITSRARAAAPFALLASAVPGVLCAIPAFVGVFAVNNGDEPLRQVALGGVVMAAAVTVSALYGAWSALSPRVVPRFVYSTRLFAGLVLLVPACAHLLVRSTVDRDIHVGLLVPLLFCLAATTLVYVSTSASDRRSVAPWVFVPAAVLLGFAGVGVALSALPPSPEPVFEDLDDLRKVIVGVLQVFAAASLAALTARVCPVPVFAAGAGYCSVMTLMVAPVVLHELGLGRSPLGFLNCDYVDKSNILLSVGFWVCLCVSALVLAGVRRSKA